MALPLLNANQSGLNLSLLDEKEVQKLLMASNRNLMGMGNAMTFNNNVNLFDSIKESFKTSFESFKESVDKGNTFLESVQTQIAELIEWIKQDLPNLEKFKKEKEDAEKEKEKKEKEKTNSLLARLLGVVTNGAKTIATGGMGVLADPSVIGHAIIGSFIGSRFAKIFAGALTSPFKTLWKSAKFITNMSAALTKHLVVGVGTLLSKSFNIIGRSSMFVGKLGFDLGKGLFGKIAPLFKAIGLKGLGIIGTLATVAYDIYDSIDEIPELMKKNNSSSVAAGIGRFFAGSGANDFASRFTHYSKWAGIGATAGIPFGPVGIVAGALIGAGIGAAGEYLGSNLISDWIDIVKGRFDGMLTLFSGATDEDREKLKATISSLNEFISSQESKLIENGKQIQVLQGELKSALAGNDKTLVASIQDKINILNAENTNLTADIEREKIKLQERINQMEVAAKEGFFERFFTSIGQMKLYDPGVSFDENGNAVYQNAADIPTVSESLASLRNKLSDYWGSLVNVYKSSMDWTSEKASDLKTFVKTKSGEVYDVFSNLISDFASWVKENFKFENIMNKASALLGFEEEPTNLSESIVKEVPVNQTLISPRFREKNVEITQRAKEANSDAAKAIRDMTLGMNALVRNDNSVNTNVVAKTSVNLRPSARDPGYNRFGGRR